MEDAGQAARPGRSARGCGHRCRGGARPAPAGRLHPGRGARTAAPEAGRAGPERCAYFSMTRATIAALVETPSLAKIRRKCVETVQPLMSSTCAIILLV